MTTRLIRLSIRASVSSASSRASTSIPRAGARGSDARSAAVPDIQDSQAVHRVRIATLRGSNDCGDILLIPVRRVLPILSQKTSTVNDSRARSGNSSRRRTRSRYRLRHRYPPPSLSTQHPAMRDRPGGGAPCIGDHSWRRANVCDDEECRGAFPFLGLVRPRVPRRTRTECRGCIPASEQGRRLRLRDLDQLLKVKGVESTRQDPRWKQVVRRFKRRAAAQPGDSGQAEARPCNGQDRSSTHGSTGSVPGMPASS